MSKGVVVQLDFDTAHILKNDGRFITCTRDMRWQIGDVVAIPRNSFMSFKNILISCAVFFSLLIGTGIGIYQIPATFIEISVNPSIQLTLNRFDRVLSVKGLNSDGDNLLQEGSSYKNLTLYEAYARLFNRLENNGYLADAVVQLIISNNSQRTVDKIEQTIRSVVEKNNEVNNMRISIKRYANDEYLSLTHPLPIIDIPNITNQGSSVQQTELPINNTTLPIPSDTPLLQPSVDDDAQSLQETDTIPTPSEDTQTQPLDITPSPSPNNNPSTTMPNMQRHGNWQNGGWQNGWWDWDCGW